MLWPDYVESAERDVLTAAPDQLDRTIGHAALLLAACGAASESDRLIRQWQSSTDRPASVLAAEPVTARAWAMLLSTRYEPPGWAAELIPLDLDAEQRAQRDHLRRGRPPLPAGGDSTAARVVSGIAGMIDGESEPDPLRSLAAEADDLAAGGSIEDARAAIRQWVHKAANRTRPDIALLAGCRHLAPLLANGTLADALGATGGWAADCAGRLGSALRARFPPEPEQHSWPELITRIMALRACGERPDAAPAPATGERIRATEQRLGARLPDGYQEFLRTCDGLAADVVFPRLLGVSELVRTSGGAIVVSEQGSEYATIVLLPDGRVSEHDPVLGTTVHRGFLAMLEEHLRLLEA